MAGLWHLYSIPGLRPRPSTHPLAIYPAPKSTLSPPLCLAGIVENHARRLLGNGADGGLQERADLQQHDARIRHPRALDHDGHADPGQHARASDARQFKHLRRAEGGESAMPQPVTGGVSRRVRDVDGTRGTIEAQVMRDVMLLPEALAGQMERLVSPEEGTEVAQQ